MYLSLLLAAPAAMAADAGDDERARDLFEQGREAYRNGNYRVALDRFAESFELSGREPLLYNIALAAEHLGDYDRAIAALEEYRPNAASKVAAVLDERIAAMERLRAQFGSVSTEAGPAPAETTGTPTEAAVAPEAEVAERGAPEASGVVIAATMTEVFRAFRQIERALPAYIEDVEELGRTQIYLAPLAQYIDFNVIGRGELAEVDTDAVLAYTVERLNEGARLVDISLELVGRFREGAFSDTGGRPSRDRLVAHVGGFLVTEFEFHQEPDGSFVPLAEINQARIYFSATLNPFASQNRFSTLIEWNPVPEEVIHQIDAVSLATGTVLTQPELEVEGLVPFEQAYARVDYIAGAPVSLSVGQFRLPFGIWSDVTSHRNFTTTKNNFLVHGFALKKIELGALATLEAGPVRVDAAVVHGRLARTAPLDRADNNDAKDVVARVRVENPLVQAAASAYLVGFQPDTNAFGASLSVTPTRLSVSGEIVWQHNGNPEGVYGPEAPTSLSSLGVYGQLEGTIHPRWRLYGMYEGWQLNVDGEAYANVAGKVFHGVRFLPHQQVRWTLLEYGHMFHEGYDEGHEHISTQLELTF